MKVHIFLQARLGSTRLPGKVLLRMCGKSVFELLVERLLRVQNAHEVILVTGPEEKNLGLVKEAKRLGMRYFCGSEENLLNRFYQAAKKFGSDGIVRITGDCPLNDVELISKGIRIFSEGTYDMVSNVRRRTYPDGMVFEIFSFKALEKSWHDQNGASESPSKYLLENPKFSNFDMVQARNMSRVRLTLDYPEDFKVIETIYNALYKEGEYFGLKEILEFSKRHPEILETNRAFIKTDYGIRPQIP